METSTKPSVIVCGAGIGGLTTAHELAKRGYKVAVYERNDIVGGLARSMYHTEESHTYPVEYSWRVYGTHYKNLLRLLGEIPLRDKPGKFVYNNLVKIDTFLFPREKGAAYILPKEKDSEPLITNFPLRDKLQILNKILFCVTMSEERMNAMDNVKWTDYCADLSEEARKYVVRIWGPVLGMDPTLMSFPVVARMMKVLLGGYTGMTGGLWVMNQPTNDGWFDEWTAHLERTGNVEIKTEHEIVDLQLEGDKITSVQVRDKKSGKTSTQKADHVVCAMSVEAIAELVEKNQTLEQVKELKNTVPLAKTARQVQLSVQLFLDQPFTYPTKKKQVLYLPDTPWALIIEPEALIWEKTYSDDERVKSVLSVGLCQTDVPGVVHGKAFTACNEQEIQDEVLAQMAASYHTSITMEDGTTIDASNIVLFYIWDTFSVTNDRMDSWEPKFSNNAGGFQYQPKAATSLSNLFFATGYTQTDRFIYSMESATEAGLRCANAILAKTKKAPTRIFSFSSSIFPFQPLVMIDKLLFKLRLPHLGKLLFSNILLTVLYFALLIWIVVRIFQGIF